MEDDLYLSLAEDIMDELIEKYNIPIETAKDVLQSNRLKERFMNNSKQFDYIETEEIAMLS